MSMRKTIITFILIVLLVVNSSLALADSKPMPAVNTDVEIKFSGFEWYTDYGTTLSTATSKGIINHYGWSRDNFDAGKLLTPHWSTLMNSLNWAANSEENCGGYLFYTSDLPKVAGYNIDELKLYFMWNPDVGPVSNYKADSAVQFYMARYEFDVMDKVACYADLTKKLKSIYGDNPYKGSYSLFSDPYLCWVNSEHAMVGLCCPNYGNITLVYCAPGSEELLVKVEKLVVQKELENAQDDMRGL